MSLAPHASAVPGPGTHSPDATKVLKGAPKYGFGSEKRDGSNSRNANGPGPGGYEIKSVIGTEGPKNSMHATIDYSPEKKENALKPGPGTYNQNNSAIKHREPGWKVGTAVRQDLEAKSRLNSTVSPDKYNPNFSTIKYVAAKWGFGSEKRKELASKDQINGPGAG